MSVLEQWSRLAGFFNLSALERRKALLSLPIGLSEEDFHLADLGLSLADADLISENVVATFGLPLAIAANFIVDDTPVLVPMVTEEPSIVAACSKMAKLVSKNGGFFTNVDRSLIKGQIQLYQLRDIDKAIAAIHTHKEDLLHWAQGECRSMSDRGGGVVDITFRLLPCKKIGPMLIVEPMMDVIDAMGANTINTLVEKLARRLGPLVDGQIGLRILSNLCDQRLARARCQIALEAISPSFSKMLAAHAFAEADIYRGATHNKGILNGIDAVALATGNDFRAIEAGAHAYAAYQGAYRPLTAMWVDEEANTLCAELTLPLAVGVVGGLVNRHHGVKLAHKILGKFANSAKGLASVMASVGLSQCLAALYALTNEGIQQGHMKLHQKKLAVDRLC